MADERRLNDPWLVAVWPGMGHVALSAGYYLMSKLGMHLIGEITNETLFDVEHIEVTSGIVRPVTLPRNLFFVWEDPDDFRDIVVFIGETQPPTGRYHFCQQLAQFAKDLGVKQVFTFAAMATEMTPTQTPRVFCVATDETTLHQLQNSEAHTLNDGQISGLNGLLVGAAGDANMPGACLLGEMPHIFAQLPYPTASLAVLRTFATLANLKLDLVELEQQAKDVDDRLAAMMGSIESAGPKLIDEPQPDLPFSEAEEPMAPREHEHIERLFALARDDRSKAFELKSELDRLGVFAEYEDQFLDLFSDPE